MNSPHLDDERLSAHLDGADLDGADLDGADPAAADHLADCGSCRGRLEALRQVAGLVGAAVPPAPAGAVDAAVVAALAVDASPGGAPVVPLSTAVRRRRTQAGLAAAAAVVAVVLGVTTFGGDGAGDGDRAALMSDTSGSATGPDLGDQSDPKALADRLRTAVEGEAVTGIASTDEGAEADRTETGQGAAGGGSAAGSAEDSTAASAPAGATARREALAAKTTSRAAGPCTATAASEYRSNPADLAFQGTLRWDGTPAVVLVYRIPAATGPLDHQVLVLARDDCRLLVAQTF